MENDKMVSIYENRYWSFTIQGDPRYFKTISIYLTGSTRTRSRFISSFSELH